MTSGPITSWKIDGETVSDFIFGGSKITADGDCSHEIERRLLLGRKVMTNLDSIFKSRDITLPTRVRLVKAIFFSYIMMYEFIYLFIQAFIHSLFIYQFIYSSIHSFIVEVKSCAVCNNSIAWAGFYRWTCIKVSFSLLSPLNLLYGLALLFIQKRLGQIQKHFQELLDNCVQS